ncbi:MAG: hypothetical protein A3F67_09330 [Verrucomicrobia bacterium RIFCSPHIGHO2_12_FULL_41_10]|nr:MAG: hypothetical protein A3F67_09330 [Verrucomicrobia bacterium RIFCSPHIGHO2_12_FULL_41_10]HLB34112.1 hypothetical protein [Chthoniobacterales bacterium]
MATKPLPALKLKGGGTGASIQNNIDPEAWLRFSEILTSIDALYFFTKSNDAYLLADELTSAAIRNTTIDPSAALRITNVAIQAFLNTAAFAQWNSSLSIMHQKALELDQKARCMNRTPWGAEALDTALAAETQWRILFESAHQATIEAQAAQDYWSSELFTPPITPRNNEE